MNAADIMMLADELKTINEKRNQQFESYHNWRTRNVIIDIPENFKKAEGYKVTQQVPNFIGEFHGRVSALLAATPPVSKVIPLGTAQKKQVQATLLERWCNQAWKKMGGREPTYSIFAESFTEYGWGVIKVIIDRHAWGGIERAEEEEAAEWNERRKEHHRKHFPFKWEVIHPSMYYPVDDGEKQVLIITKRRAKLVAIKYGLKLQNGKLVKPEHLGPKGPDHNWPDTVDFIEYWDEDDVYYVVDEEIVEHTEHGYGRPPFFVAYARPSVATSPEEKSLSYLDNLIPVTKSMANLMTILFSWFQLNGFPSFNLTPVTEFAEPLEKLGEGPIATIVPGGVNKIPWGFRGEWTGAPPIGSIADSLVNYLVSQYRESSLAAVLMGESPGADMSGTALVTIIAVAKSIFAPGLMSIEGMFSEIAKFLLQRIEFDFEEPVPIRVTDGDQEEWVDLGKDDIDGYWEVEHIVKPVIPAEMYQNYMMVADAFARKLATRREAIESRGVEAPEEILAELLADDYTQMPQFVNLVLQKVAEMLGGTPPGQPGTQAMPPIGPGGPAAPVMAGIQQPLMPQGPMPVR